MPRGGRDNRVIIPKRFKDDERLGHLVAATLVEHLFEPARNARTELDARIKDSLNEYEVVWGEGVNIPEGTSARRMPDGWHAANLITAEQMRLACPTENWFNVLEEDERDSRFADQISAELIFRLDQMHFIERLRPLIMQNALVGYSPFEIYWADEYRRFVRRVQRDGSLVTKVADALGMHRSLRKELAGLQEMRDERPTYQGFRLAIENALDVWLEPHPQPSQQPQHIYRIRKRKMTLAELQRLGGVYPGGYRVYENLDKVKPQESENDGQGDKEALWRALGVDEPRATRPDATVDILEFQGDFPCEIDGDTYVFENWIVAVANRKTLIRFEPNTRPSGRLPLQFMTYAQRSDPNMPMGVGALEKALPISSMLNANANNFNELVKRMLRGLYTYKVGDPFFDPDEVEMGASPWIGVRDHDTINPIPADVRLFSLVEMIPMWRQYYQEATGAPENLTTESYRKSATEIAQIVSRVDTRFRNQARHNDVEAFEPTLEDMVAIMAENPPERVVHRSVRGESASERKWVGVEPEAFRRRFVIKAQGADLARQMHEQISSLRVMLEIVAVAPPEVQAKVNYGKLLQLAMKWTLGQHEDDLYLDSPAAEMMREIDARRSAEGAARGTAGNAAAGGRLQGAAGIVSLANTRR